MECQNHSESHFVICNMGIEEAQILQNPLGLQQQVTWLNPTFSCQHHSNHHSLGLLLEWPGSFQSLASALAVLSGCLSGGQHSPLLAAAPGLGAGAGSSDCRGKASRLTRSSAKVRTTYSASASVPSNVILMSPYMSDSSGQYREHFTWSCQSTSSEGSSQPQAHQAPSPSPAYPAHLYELGDHDDAGTVLLPYHAPEVVDHLRFRPWRVRQGLANPGPTP